MDIKVGCCGFSEAHYKYYAHFNLVEVQSTFYQPPKLNTAVKWRESSPENFEFTIKAWQLITHTPSSATYRRLREPISPRKNARYGFFKPTREVFQAWETTKNFAQSLGARHVLFQSPNSFKPTDENIRNLKKFFDSIDRESLNLIWEPRDGWKLNMVKELCNQLDLVHCADPFQNETFSEPVKYYRLHGKRGFRSKYSDQDLLQLKEICERDEVVYCLFNNISMREDALRFNKLFSS
ncbi:MAG: DUF72 domain-containing protein [bacterium]